MALCPALCEFMCRAATGSYTAADDASALGVRCKTRYTAGLDTSNSSARSLIE
jgi:hypothetical protein